MKAVETERKTRETMGLPSFTGLSSTSPKYYSNTSISSNSMHIRKGIEEPSVETSKLPPPPSKIVRKGLNLGKNVTNKTTASMIDQLKKEGEIVEPVVQIIPTPVEPYVFLSFPPSSSSSSSKSLG